MCYLLKILKFQFKKRELMANLKTLNLKLIFTQDILTISSISKRQK